MVSGSLAGTAAGGDFEGELHFWHSATPPVSQGDTIVARQLPLGQCLCSRVATFQQFMRGARGWLMDDTSAVRLRRRGRPLSSLGQG